MSYILLATEMLACILPCKGIKIDFGMPCRKRMLDSRPLPDSNICTSVRKVFNGYFRRYSSGEKQQS